MKSSGISSGTGAPLPGSHPPSDGANLRQREQGRERRDRDGFALTGRSAILDPKTHAVRPDLADVRLARQVFAPHYAAFVPRVLTAETPLRAGRDGTSDVLAVVASGARFELLDLIGGDAWGIVPDQELVGYLDASLLAEPGA